MHWSPNFSAASLTKARRATAAVLIDTLSAPEAKSLRMSSMVRTPPPTVSGMKQASAVRRTTSRMMSRFSWLAVMSRNVSSSAPSASWGIAASTGSPASRRSRNFTPLTTRPSLTSRQGMTRTLNMSSRRRARRADQPQRVRRIEPAVVERAAGNGAGKFLGARLQQRHHVRDRSEPARGDDGDAHRLGERDGGVDVEAREQAVAGNVGVDQGRDAHVFEPFGDVEGAELRCFRPTRDRHHAVAGVERDRDAGGVEARGLGDERRIAHRRSADDDTGEARVGPGPDGGDVANAAAEL